MKKKLLTLLGFVLISMPLTVTAEQSGDFTYSSDGSAITITDYTGAGGAVIIPSTIESKPVTSIGTRAFMFCGSLTSVTIPASVTSIGIDAFSYCNNLTAFTVDALSSFYSSLDGVLFNKSQTTLIQYPEGKVGSCYTIPDSVTSIESFAFGECTGLTSVMIPANVTSIGNYVFSGCTSLQGITVDALSSFYSSLDGVLFNKSQTTLIQYPEGKAGSCYTIPDSVISIGDYAFFSQDNLTSVMIPSSVTSIGDYAFHNCNKLTNVTIGNSVTSIGGNAFSYCNRLTSIMIPDNVTSIGGWTFIYCTSLTNVTIGNSVTSIGESAFNHCESLTSVTIPASVTSIEWVAFKNCNSLMGVYFKGNAPSVGGGVFDYADNVTVYYLAGTTGWGTTFGGRPTALWNVGGTFQFSASSASVNENAGSVTLTVTRSGGSSGAASVNYATANGTASAGTDYTATSGDFTWADGNSDTKTITVPISDDSLADGDKYFTVQLSAALGASLGSTYFTTVTIVDNEIPTDTTSPTVRITSPTSASTYSTGSSSINISGTASDNIGVTRVAWANDRGGSGDCSGTTSWSKNGITLYSGQNIITITAYDSAGNPGSDTLTVTYTPSVLSASISLLSGSGELYINNTISFSANVSGDQGSMSYQWDLNGDGSFDDAASQQVSYQYSTEGTRLVQVRVTDESHTALAKMFIMIGKPPVPNEPPTPPIPNVPGSARDPLNGTNAFIPDVSKKNNGLIIIAHGMNTSSSSDWIAPMAKAITNKLGRSTPNIMAWDWEDLAVVDADPISEPIQWLYQLGKLRSNGCREGGRVAEWIIENITANNIDQNKPIHIIGHSAGGFIGGGCAMNIPLRINQISLLDTPIYPAGIMYTYLPGNSNGNADFYITQYGTMPNTIIYHKFVVRHQLHAYDLPETLPARYLDHVGVHEWYREQTIAGTVREGFWYSPWTENDFPFRRRKITNNEMEIATRQPKMIEIGDFNTFGQVTCSDDKYILTEGTGNAGIFKTLEFPVGAQSLFFEYSFTAPGDGDYLGVFVGTNDTIFIGDDLQISRSNYLVGEGYVASYSGQVNQLIFKLHSVGSQNAQVTIKSIRIFTEDDLSGSESTCLAGDFDGDGKADPAAVDTNRNWYVWFSSGNYLRSGPFALGQADWLPVAGDFDGDRLADPVMVDLSGNWYVWFSSGNYQRNGPFALGQADWTPVAGDFDGDGKADPTMVDTSGTWYIWKSGNNYTRFDLALSSPSGTPVLADFDGDGKADPAICLDGSWYVYFSTGNYTQFGPFPLDSISDTTATAGDVDGDRLADPIMVDSSGNWYIWFSSGNYQRNGPFSLTVP